MSACSDRTDGTDPTDPTDRTDRSDLIGLPTRGGLFRGAFTERGLAALEFPRRGADEARSLADLPTKQRRWAMLTVRALERVLEGKPPGSLPPLDESGTLFQRAVWQVLRSIPPGETRTYAEVARLVGRPAAAARAVGQACGANPIPVLTPCHRVLAAGGRLGGFSGGLDWKRRLLEGEGVVRKQ